MVLNFPVMSESAVICDHGKTLFATHGHIYGPDKLPPLADGTFFLYGHTYTRRSDQTAGQEKHTLHKPRLGFHTEKRLGTPLPYLGGRRF